MLREDRRAAVERGVLRYRFAVGPLAGGWMGGGAYRRLIEEQRSGAVPVLEDESRRWWMFRDRVYWEDEGLDADEVTALVLDRERRRRRRIERAKDLMALEGAAPRREPIPEAVRREVFRRDGGRCVSCGSVELLQFDHVIPVALGGAHSADNLQVLCAPCNRDKGGAL